LNGFSNRSGIDASHQLSDKLQLTPPRLPFMYALAGENCIAESFRQTQSADLVLLKIHNARTEILKRMHCSLAKGFAGFDRI
jgi:hypothetical protein